MKMRELSEASGVSVPTIKYYIREDLLQPGKPTAPNQADYGEEHLRRLALIRALRDVGGLSIATIRQVLQQADATKLGTVAAAGQAMDALVGEPGELTADERETVERVAGSIRHKLYRAGWNFRPSAAALPALARAFVRGRRAMGLEPDVEMVLNYAEPMMEIAQREFDANAPQPFAGEDTIAWAMLGTVLYEPVILLLRRLAHEHMALAQLPPEVREKIASGRRSRKG